MKKGKALDTFTKKKNFFLAYFFGGAIFFLTHYFANFFHESDITCIITVVGAQQQHKGMFLKHGAAGS